MAKKFTKKLHYWPVEEKRSIYELIKQGKTTPEIRLTLYKGDRTVTDRSLATQVNKIKKDPSYVEHPPQYPNGKVPTAISYSERKKKKSSRSRSKERVVTGEYHRWTEEENQIIIDNLTLTPVKMKKKFFRGNREITLNKLRKKVERLRRDSREGKIQTSPKPQSSPSPFSVRRESIGKTPPVQLAIDFTGKADELWNKFNKKTSLLKDDLKTLQELIDASAFESSTKEEMKSAISRIAAETFRKEQNTLAESLKV